MYCDKEKLLIYNQLRMLLSKNEVLSNEMDRIFIRSNLAYFIDCNANNDNWEELVEILRGLAMCTDTVNELSYLIASTNIHFWVEEITKDKSLEEIKSLEKIGRCMLAPYTYKFKEGILKEFAIVGRFPQWFVDYESQNISNYCSRNEKSKEDVQKNNPKVAIFNDLMSIFSSNDLFRFVPKTKKNKGNIAYFIEHYSDSEEWSFLYSYLCSAVEKSSINDLCFLLYNSISAAFLKELSETKTEKYLKGVINAMDELYGDYENDYKAGKLNRFKVVGEAFYPDWYKDMFN